MRRSGTDDRRRPPPPDEGRAADRRRPGFHCRAGQRTEIRARPEARPGLARNRAGAAGDDGEADLRRHRVGLQLYPDKNHSVLIGAITAQGAEVDPVLPYIYDAQVADANVVTAIDEMAQGRIDAIALTSSGQVRRLVEVAQAHRCEVLLRDGLARTPIASVGPVVSDELTSHGLRTDIYPANDAYFMKPLISAMAAALGKTEPRAAAKT